MDALPDGAAAPHLQQLKRNYRRQANQSRTVESASLRPNQRQTRESPGTSALAACIAWNIDG